MLTKERKRQNQVSRGYLRKRRSENTQQTHRRTPTVKHDLNKDSSKLHKTMLRQGCSPQLRCILTEHHAQEYLRLVVSEEREVSKSIYKKFYSKVYETLLE